MSTAVAIEFETSGKLELPQRGQQNLFALIHGDEMQLRPYTISYVCNRHQNDAAHPDYNGFRNPEFFVTLNPAIPIPESYVLKQADGTPAVTHFTHNIVNVATLKAQEFLMTRLTSPP